MAAFPEDDLISLTTTPSTTMAPSPAFGSPSGKMDDARPRQVSNDSFASLTDLIKSKKQWTTAPKPRVPVPNGPSDRKLPIHPPPQPQPLADPYSPSQPIQSFRDESVFSAPSPVREYNAFRLSTDSTATPLVDVSQSPVVKSSVIKAFIPPKSHPLGEYDETAMTQMEAMMAEMANLDSTDADAQLEYDPAKEAPSQQPVQNSFSVGMVARPGDDAVDAYSRSSTPAFRTADQGPVVKLTQDVWNTMTAQIATLKKEKAEALDRVADLQCRNYLPRQVVSANATELDELRYRLEANKDYKATMSREIRSKDTELYKQGLEIDELKKRIVEMEAQHELLRTIAADADYLRTSLAKAAQEQEAHEACFAQVIECKDQEIAKLKDEVARNTVKMSGHQARANNLADTQLAREKKLRQTELQLEAAQDEKEKILDELDHLKTKLRPFENRIKELETQLREKTSSCDRMRNDLQYTQRRLELANKSLSKVENSLQLKAAAHLIVPSDKTKLPSKVLPCLQCFAKNVECDARTRCEQCTIHDTKCARWRCSQMHILHKCPDLPCMLDHDPNGWLVLKNERPQW